MQDVVVVHRLHAEAHLDEEGPDGRLGQVPRATLGLEQLQQVALTGELGHNVEDVLLDESLVECDHMLTRNGGEDANLVDGLGALLGRHLTRVNLLDRVDFAVNLSSRLVHGAKLQTGLTCPVRVLESKRVGSPMTWGSLRPIVLMPADAEEWPMERRRIVLLHELVHILRGDWLLLLAAQLACALHWFNPLVWIARQRLAVERELACDEDVLGMGTRPSDYATVRLSNHPTDRPTVVSYCTATIVSYSIV